MLGDGWDTSDDRMWTTSADSAGFHLLVAEAKTGYTWRTAASLSQPGFEADQWIGNACVTGSGRRAVAVYAPRTFTNSPQLFARGAFTAVVDLLSGTVTELPIHTSLAYFNPACGAGETVVLTQSGDEDLGKTRVRTVDAVTGTLGEPIDVPGQLTSPVPVPDGILAADANAVVRVQPDGKRTVVATASGVPFHLLPDRDGGLVFMDSPEAATGRIRRLANTRNESVPAGEPSTLATGRLGEFDATASSTRKIFITGTAKTSKSLPPAVTRLSAPATAAMSTRAESVVSEVSPADQAESQVSAADPSVPKRIRIKAKSLKTNKDLTFTVDPGDTMTPRSITDDPGRYCAVPRNDPNIQVYQPKPRQVEWAANMAVKGHLEIVRPANWKNNGLVSYDPQALFPQVPLKNTTNGQVPAQILLGILGQESNLWQASRHVLPGQTGNPLIGNYYGLEIYNSNDEDDWDIHWDKADCGYGVTQMTDGMRLAGHEKPNETALSPEKQRAIATDYVANLAAGLRLLETKWNELQDANMRLNNNDPSKPENWYFAIWAYNSGLHQAGEPNSAGAYGLGWGNNPINPHYDPDRTSFGVLPTDFSKPQKWPYQEKVLGFAANPPYVTESPGIEVPMFRPASWNGTNGPPEDERSAVYRRLHASPNFEKFCTAANNCVSGQKYTPNYPGDSNGAGDVRGEPAGPCAHKNGQYYDLKCWWHDSFTWKSDCDDSCGNEFIRFDYPDYKQEQADGTSFPAKCQLDGLPSNAMIVDDIPSSVPSVSAAGCSRPANSGSFDFQFSTDSNGFETSKIDLHQIGGGFGAHFWFGHGWRGESGTQKLLINGTWTFNQPVNGWARVLVHLPDHGAQTRQAKYVIDLGNGSRYRIIPQRIQENRWVSLGAFPFAGIPKISLSNKTADIHEEQDGLEDVAWDAMAVAPLNHKPSHVIAALGDSYSSGEGASRLDGSDYYRESDVDGDAAGWRDACHRSKYAWSRVMTLADSPQKVGERQDALDPEVEYHMVACSGARTKNVISAGTTNGFGQNSDQDYGEVAQLESGFVDQDTTLVTLSIGGNDARFAKIVQKCLYGTLFTCLDSTLDGDSAPLHESEPAIITNETRRSVEIVLDQIHAKAPDAQIVLVGYPILFEKYGQCLPLELGLSAEEGAWMNQMTAMMTGQMKVAVENANTKGIPATFSDPSGVFEGKALCGDPELLHEIVTDLTPGDSPWFEYADRKGVVSAQGFHPNIDGAAAYAKAVTATLRSIGL